MAERHYFAELRRLAGDWLAAFGELHSFGWAAGQTRNHTVKAVGTGEDQGEVLYGDDARAALAPDGPQAPRSIDDVAVSGVRPPPPPPPPAPDPGEPTTPKADGQHQLRGGGTPVTVRGYDPARVRGVLGRAVHPADLAAMSMAVPGAAVKVTYAYTHGGADGKTLVATDVLTEVKGPGYFTDRIFSRGPDGKLECHNDLFVIKKNKAGSPENPGLPSGTDLLAAQVAALQRAGVARIHIFAAGNPKGRDPNSTMNGYYTWPRLGYDGEVPGFHWDTLPDEIKRLAKPRGDIATSRGSSVRVLCLTPRGRDWWKVNGRPFNAVFDLTPGSASLKTLAAYIAERNFKKGLESGRGTTEGPPAGTPGTSTHGEGPGRAGQTPGRGGAAHGRVGTLAGGTDRPGRRAPLTAGVPLVHAFSWGDWKPDPKNSARMVSPGGRKLPRETWEKLSRASHDRVRPGRRGLPQPGELRHVHPDAVHVDPQRFQFKTRTDPATGAGRELQGVQHYNPELAGVLAVWHDPADGKSYVINGHHRLDLARRAKAARVLVRYIHARNAQEARAKGALINIAEGRGTAVDAAKFLRDTNTTVDDLAKTGVSLSGPVARDAVTLSNLDPGLFHRVTLGVLDVPRAIAVATHLPDHDDQRTLLAHIDRQDARTGREMSPGAVAEAAKEMAATPKATVAGPSDSLFGNDPAEESVFLQRAELKAHVRKELARQAKDFGLLASKRRVESTAGVGNVIDPAKNRAAGEQARGLVEDFDRKVNRSGAVSDVINRAAGRLANAHTAAARDRVFRDVVGEVRRAIEGGGLQMMSEWVGELRPFWVETFAWKQGKRGGRYWLPDGKQDVPPNRLYGRKADSAARAEQASGQRAQVPATGPRPGEAHRVARAKFEVARDAHREASKPGSGATPEQVEWLRKRAERAAEDLARHEPTRETASPRQAVPAAPGGKGELLTPADKHTVAHRRERAEHKSRLARFVNFARAKYKSMEDRYGQLGAGVVTAAWLSPFFGAGPAATITAEIARGAVKGVQALGHAVGIGGDDKPPTHPKGNKPGGHLPEPAPGVNKAAAAKPLPDHAKNAGFRDWEEIDRRGLRGVVEGAPEMAREALVPAAAKLRGSFAAKQNHIATEIVRRAKGAGLDGALRSIASEFLTRASYQGGEPGQREEDHAVGTAVEEYRHQLAARDRAARSAAPAEEITPAEKRAWDQLARAEVGTPAYARAKVAVVRARLAAKQAAGDKTTGGPPGTA